MRCKVGDGQKTYSQLGFVDDSIYTVLEGKMALAGGTFSGAVKIADAT